MKDDTLDAIRKLVKPKNHKISITLPVSFDEDYVEVIVLPVNKTDYESTNSKKNILKKFLLDAPIMSDKDYKDFLEKREHFNQWKTSV
ncbi:MAG: hypothetical protein HW421_3311 [Ignavibacteria bacterium]|nr:hypothetical protein [Ignavibacteria bacterium]